MNLIKKTDMPKNTIKKINFLNRCVLLTIVLLFISIILSVINIRAGMYSFIVSFIFLTFCIIFYFYLFLRYRIIFIGGWWAFSWYFDKYHKKLDARNYLIGYEKVTGIFSYFFIFLLFLIIIIIFIETIIFLITTMGMLENINLF